MGALLTVAEYVDLATLVGVALDKAYGAVVRKSEDRRRRQSEKTQHSEPSRVSGGSDE